MFGCESVESIPISASSAACCGTAAAVPPPRAPPGVPPPCGRWGDRRLLSAKPMSSETSEPPPPPPPTSENWKDEELVPAETLCVRGEFSAFPPQRDLCSRKPWACIKDSVNTYQPTMAGSHPGRRRCRPRAAASSRTPPCQNQRGFKHCTLAGSTSTTRMQNPRKIHPLRSYGHTCPLPDHHG